MVDLRLTEATRITSETKLYSIASVDCRYCYVDLASNRCTELKCFIISETDFISSQILNCGLKISVTEERSQLKNELQLRQMRENKEPKCAMVYSANEPKIKSHVSSYRDCNGPNYTLPSPSNWPGHEMATPFWKKENCNCFFKKVGNPVAFYVQ